MAMWLASDHLDFRGDDAVASAWLVVRIWSRTSLAVGAAGAAVRDGKAGELLLAREVVAGLALGRADRRALGRAGAQL